MIRRLAAFFVRLAQRYMPDPFLFAVLLTLATFALARAATPHGTAALLNFWYEGLWKILSFAMQMILILLTGYALATSGPVRALLERVAARSRTPRGAVVLVILAGTLSSLVNWGFGLVVSALLAREVARRVPVDYAFLVACAYSGFVLFASGLSSSIALVSASAGHSMNVIARFTGRAVTPAAEMLLAPYNLALIAATLLLLPLMMVAVMPPARERPEDIPERPFESSPGASPCDALPGAPNNDTSPAARLENSPALSLVLVAMGVAYLSIYFYRNGPAINLDLLVFIFLMAGLLLHWRPIAYVRAFNQASEIVGPLALQYPLYGGIMGLMVDSGLAVWISNGFLAISTARTLPLWTFCASVVMSFFVPSGGGQWVVQGPLVIPASVALGVAPSVTAMAVAFGDQAGNMLQPFWALPILAISRLGIRDIMGYCVMTFLLASLLSLLALGFLA